eukprot:jgi/Psemu1/308497/fgenesh1_kg.416_\
MCARPVFQNRRSILLRRYATHNDALQPGGSVACRLTTEMVRRRVVSTSAFETS